jgi:hypothetical protein
MEGSSITGGPFPRGDLPKTGLDLGADGHEANLTSIGSQSVAMRVSGLVLARCLRSGTLQT